VDISKLKSVIAVPWLLVIKIGDFSNKVKKQLRFLCEVGQRYDRRKTANPLCSANLRKNFES